VILKARGAEGPIRRPERGGSEWEPIKILLQRENSAYTTNSQPRIPTRVCQGHVVKADLPTLGTNPKRSQSGSTTQEAKDLAIVRKPWRTVREAGVDGPRGQGGQSVKRNRTTSSAPQNADGPYPTRGLSESNLCRADGLRPLDRRSAKPLPVRNNWPNGLKRERSRTSKEHEEHLTNFTSRTVCLLPADGPPGTGTTA
jgi:hypothetical protein